MAEPLYNVLFLCTGNSARSIIAESILRKDGAGRFNAFSAGSQPRGTVNPLAIAILENMNYPTGNLCSKSWNEFIGPGAPKIDFAFTVCDSARGEVCPVWPDRPVTSHWGIDDPTAVGGKDFIKGVAFGNAFRYLKMRISGFMSLPLTSLDAMSLKDQLRKIGLLEGATKLRPEVT
ncbi:MAG: arsenate reductase ArsC [Beijerinckiaceae bacterium]|jgi:protein-tyrosine-phosphatase